MSKFRKKPVVIEAVQIKKGMGCPIWLVEAIASNKVIVANLSFGVELPAFAKIETLEGIMRGDDGDWIIRGVKGELYPCKADIFEATYEPVED
jgi:hypothetical protein